MNKLLEVQHVRYSYKESRTILKDISFSIERGQLITLLGPNGAGKSTLLNCIAGLFKPDSGTIPLDGKELHKLSPKEIARKIAYVPQITSVTYDYSVRDYIAMGRAPHLDLFNQPGKKDYELVQEAIEMMGIEKLADQSISKISGGERQMASITRAIVQQAELILFDEPTSALDFGNQMKIMKVIDKLSKQGFAIMFTTHNPDQPILLGGTVALVNDAGEMIIGDGKDIMKEELLSRIYKTPLSISYVDNVKRFACLAHKLE